MSRTLAVLLCLFGLTTSAADSRDVGPDKIDVSAFPAEEQARYRTFEVKCSKCHSLARPINARIEGTAWKGYIKKMIRRPGSGINEEAGQQVYLFLLYYSTVGKTLKAPTAGTGK